MSHSFDLIYSDDDDNDLCLAVEEDRIRLSIGDRWEEQGIVMTRAKAIEVAHTILDKLEQV